jgi:hypothetical protein
MPNNNWKKKTTMMDPSWRRRRKSWRWSNNSKIRRPMCNGQLVPREETSMMEQQLHNKKKKPKGC